MSYFIYQKKNSKDFGLQIEKKSILSSPSLEQEFVDIPGRDGSLLLPGGHFSNQELSFSCFILAKDRSDLIQKTSKVKAWLLQKSDQYHRLECSDEPDVYYRAVFSSKLDIEEELKRIGRMKIAFQCLPYHYLKSGEERLKLSLPQSSVTNPSLFSSLPLIEIVGTGDLTFRVQNDEGNYSFLLKGEGKKITIDSEKLLVYAGEENRSNVFVAKSFPFLAPGENYLEASSNISEFSLQPNWRSL